MIGSAHTFRRLASATGLAALVVAVAIPTAFAKPLAIDGELALRPRRGAAGTDAGPRSGDRHGDELAPEHRSRPSIRVRPTRSTRQSRPRWQPSGISRVTTCGRPTRAMLLASLHAPVATPTTFVSSHTSSEGSDWGNVMIVLAAIGASFLLVGFGGHALVTRNGRGKRTGSVSAA